MTELRASKSDVFISYRQFHIYDRDVPLSGCAWTQAHFDQGFARRKSVVNVKSLIDTGTGQLFLALDNSTGLNEYSRVIAVPFDVTSGTVVVAGPEDEEYAFVPVPIGTYRLVVAQKAINEELEEISLFFETRPGFHGPSEVLIADSDLHPSLPLVEDADIA